MAALILMSKTALGPFDVKLSTFSEVGVVYREINMVYFKATVSNGVKNHEKILRNSIRVVVHLGGMVRFLSLWHNKE